MKIRVFTPIGIIEYDLGADVEKYTIDEYCEEIMESCR